MLVQYKRSFLQQVVSELKHSSDITTAFPNLAKLALILKLILVTTPTVEHNLSSVKGSVAGLMNKHSTYHCTSASKAWTTNDTLKTVLDHYNTAMN